MPNYDWSDNGPSKIFSGDNLLVMKNLPDESFTVCYLDPPFNTGRKQTRISSKSTANHLSSRKGFGDRTYDFRIESVTSYDDQFEDYWRFLAPRLIEAWRLLTENGTMYLHLDWRESHYAKVAMDQLFGRENFLNEIIWAYDYGAKSKRKWPTKHDTILVYAKKKGNHIFNNEEIDREPYMAPNLVGPAKAAKGKLPTDVWWHTIVSPTGREKTGYATQKPLGILRRVITASSKPGNWILDPFGGSGTTGHAAGELGRKFVLIDSNQEALRIMTKRLSHYFL